MIISPGVRIFSFSFNLSLSLTLREIHSNHHNHIITYKYFKIYNKPRRKRWTSKKKRFHVEKPKERLYYYFFFVSEFIIFLFFLVCGMHKQNKMKLISKEKNFRLASGWQKTDLLNPNGPFLIYAQQHTSCYFYTEESEKLTYIITMSLLNNRTTSHSISNHDLRNRHKVLLSSFQAMN